MSCKCVPGTDGVLTLRALNQCFSETVMGETFYKVQNLSKEWKIERSGNRLTLVICCISTCNHPNSYIGLWFLFLCIFTAAMDSDALPQISQLNGLGAFSSGCSLPL